MADKKVPDMISAHELPGRRISDTAQHLAKLRQGHNIGIGGKQFFIVSSLFHSDTSIKLLVNSRWGRYTVFAHRIEKWI